MSYYTLTDQLVLLPAILLALFGCATLLFDFLVFPGAKQRRYLVWFLLLGEAFVAIALLKQTMHLRESGADLSGLGGAVIIDGFALYFNWIFLAATVIVGMISYRYFEVREEHHGEFYGLLMLAQCGMFFLASGNELVTLFIGLETMAVSFYILVGFLRNDKRSNEAALKYLLLGGFSSGFLAYGFSLLYGISGSTRLTEIGSAVQALMEQHKGTSPLLFLAVGTVLVGLFFKISAAPFHMWAPDAYEGAPTTVTAYLAVASKAASLALLMRLLLGPLASAREIWEPILIGAALLSMTVGNLAAVTQTNTKRLLAYSSINHAGYILLGVIAGNETGIKGVLVYILIYAFMNLGAFLVLTSLASKGIAGEDINDLSGLMHKSPAHALWMLVFLLSLAGIPPTAGFLGKYYIFLALIQTGHVTLAIVAALYVAVAIFYYFRIVRVMFTADADANVPVTPSLGMSVSLAVTGVLTLGIGLYPEPWLRFAQWSNLIH
jgi:NADH-quinone oxidoreductase subunit N